MDALPLLVIGRYCGGQSVADDRAQHGIVAVLVGGEGACDGDRQFVVGVVEWLAGFAVDGQSGGDDAVGDGAHLGHHVPQVAHLASLGGAGALGIVVVDVLGELLAQRTDPADDSPDIDRSDQFVALGVLEEQLLVLGLAVDAFVADLFEVGDTEQGVAVQDLVVHEAEWLVRVERDEPQGQFAHLDGHLIDVHAVQAGCHHLSYGPASHLLRRLAASLALVAPCLDELVGQVSCRGDQEGTRTACDVGDLEVQDLVRGEALPLGTVLGLVRAGLVDEGFERVHDDVLGQGAWRVVRAGACPRGGLLDVQVAGLEHHGLAAQVAAHQGNPGHDAGAQLLVVTDGQQHALRVVRQVPGQFLGDLALGARHGVLAALLDPFDDGLGALGAIEVAVLPVGDPFELRQRYFRFLASLAGQAQDDLVGARACVAQEAFVDVADLFDVDVPEGDAARLVVDDGDLHGLQDAQHDQVGHVDPQFPVVVGGHEEGVAALVEDGASIGGQAHVLEVGARVHGLGGGQQPVPGHAGAVHGFLALVRGARLELVEHAQQPVAVLEQGALGQQSTLLGE